MVKHIIFIVTLCIISINYAQERTDSIKCNINVLLKFDNNLDSLDTNSAREFFLTFDKACKNNAEYSEWSNELLFKFLDRYPRKFINVLLLKEKYDLISIFKNLESPINDGFDLDKIYKGVEAIDLHNSVKKEILKRIKIALNNH